METVTLQQPNRTGVCTDKIVSDLKNSILRLRCGLGCLLFAAGLWIATTVCFIGGWDEVAAITLFPYWSWMLIGLLAAYAAWRLGVNRWVRTMLILWVIANLCFADNLMSMIRLVRRDNFSLNQHPSELLRVVSLNCAGRSSAAEELSELKPDIVLLQEIPATNDLARLAREWFGEFGSFVAGFDCAILSGFPLKIAGDHRSPQHIQALMELPTNGSVLVTSLRFIPPAARFDLWNPSAWRASVHNRRLRRSQLRAALERDTEHAHLPEVFGGDFNAPSNDSVFKLLAEFTDAHREAGRGWGNTALNNFPIARPDQIWLKRFRVVAVRAIRSNGSDHRIVVADIESRK